MRVILVSNRLPIKIASDGTVTRTSGGLASALEGAAMKKKTLWVGWPGIATGAIEDMEATKGKMREAGVLPVFLSEEELDGYYEGYANGTLWPLLHYMTGKARFQDEWAERYRNVNEKFAEVVLSEAKEADVVWIHDYHLFLLPSLLRGTGKRLRVGFFLHTPFPSSEIFRVLPERGEILNGLLGADLIGFHTYGYLRHFRSSLLRILGVEAEMDELWHQGRRVRMGVFPIGHNRRGFQEVRQGKVFEKALAEHSKELKGYKLILSVERLDYTKGLPQKLAAIRRFLEEPPRKRQESLFLLIAVPSRQGVEEYDQLTEEVQREVGSINGDYGMIGHSPVQFLHRGFPLEDLAALYALADVCLVTPLIDGMNLVAKEFVDCQDDKHGRKPGVLVLSEFAGAAQELSHALQVNPHDIQGVADTLSRALDMDDEERWDRIKSMQPRLERNDSSNWARLFLKELDVEPEVETGATLVDAEELADKLFAETTASGRLGVFLDYDGTLRGFVDVPQKAYPDENLRKLLQNLNRMNGVNVAVVSGRPPGFLEKHLGDLGITLVGEHGYRYKKAGDVEWGFVHSHIDNSWKDVVRPLLQQAEDLTPGTHLEEKQSAIVWHYRQADLEFGSRRARALLDELTEMTANLPVVVHHGNKIVEVSSQLVNKGIAMEMLIKEWRCSHALCAGDDQTDESMFAVEAPGVELETIKVGNGTTRAKHRTTIKGLRNLLEIIGQS